MALPLFLYIRSLYCPIGVHTMFRRLVRSRYGPILLRVMSYMPSRSRKGLFWERTAAKLAARSQNPVLLVTGDMIFFICYRRLMLLITDHDGCSAMSLSFLCYAFLPSQLNIMTLRFSVSVHYRLDRGKSESTSYWEIPSSLLIWPFDE